MSTTRRPQPKRDFATRLSHRTLAQLDALVGLGAFRNRTEAIEAAVDRLHDAAQRDTARRRHAFDRACGALVVGVGPEAWRAAGADRLDWEASRHAAQPTDR